MSWYSGREDDAGWVLKWGIWVSSIALVDWIIIVVVSFSTLISIMRGFVKEALSLVTFVAAMIISRIFGPQLSTLLVDLIDSPSTRQMTAYIGLFFATLIVGGLINTPVSQVVKWAGLSGVDKLLGMLFGFARGALIIVVIVAILSRVGLSEDRWWQESILIPAFLEASDWLQAIDWQDTGDILKSAQSI